MASSQSYGCPLWPRAIATSQATIKVDEQYQPGHRGRPQVDLREPLVAADGQPPDGLAAARKQQDEQAEAGQDGQRDTGPRRAGRPASWPAKTTTPSPRQNSGMNHLEREIAWLRTLIIEHLLDRDAKVAGQRHAPAEARGCSARSRSS